VACNILQPKALFFVSFLLGPSWGHLRLQGANAAQRPRLVTELVKMTSMHVHDGICIDSGGKSKELTVGNQTLP
jgi:hypothetical protein